MSEKNKSGFIHVVFFWLNEGVTETQKKDFEAGLAKLGTVSTLQQYYFGPPAQTPRTVVDNSYDYSIVSHFADKAGHDIYQDDPIHHEFIANHKDLWARVQVYDVVV